MRRRKLSDDERQAALFDNSTRASWPVVHAGLAAKVAPLFGPVSDETGGPLNAIEAGRVMTRKSIRFAGHIYDGGIVYCRECAQWSVKERRVPCSSFRRTIYSGTEEDMEVGRCEICNTDVVGEDPRQHDRSL